MTQEAVERLLGRMLTDDGFRYAAVRSMKAAAAAEGYMLSAEELEALRTGGLQQLELVAAQLNRSIKRFSRESGTMKVTTKQIATNEGGACVQECED